MRRTPHDSSRPCLAPSPLLLLLGARQAGWGAEAWVLLLGVPADAARGMLTRTRTRARSFAGLGAGVRLFIVNESTVKTNYAG